MAIDTRIPLKTSVMDYGKPANAMLDGKRQGGGNPMGMYKNFAGGGGASGGTAGASGGSSGSSAMSGAGPWAALAIAVMWNEENSRKQGRRSEDTRERFMDQITGKVLQQDAEHYGDKVGGIGGELIEIGGKMGNPEGQFDLMKDSVEKPLQWLQGLF